MLAELCVIAMTFLGSAAMYFSCTRTIAEDERGKLVQP
jgi:hypothetical protein